MIDPPLALSIEILEAGDDRTVVRVAGEIDTASRDALERELLAAVQDRPGHLALDLSGVDFLDSSGLSALLAVQQAVAGQGGQVTIVGSTPMIDRLLEITGLQTLFPHDER